MTPSKPVVYCRSRPVPVPEAHVDLVVADRRARRSSARSGSARNGTSIEKPRSTASAPSIRPKYSQEVCAQGATAAVGQGLSLVGDHEVGIDLEPDADARALGARAVGRVEGERARLDLLERERVVVGARALLGVPASRSGCRGASTGSMMTQPVRDAERRLDRVGETATHPVARDEPVDDHVDRVLELLLQRRRLGQRHDLAVDPRPREALGLQLVEEVLVLALAAADHRRQHLVPRALRQLEKSVDDLLRRLRRDPLAAHRAELRPDAREQEPQVVVDLGDRPDGRPRVPVRGLLVDRDRRGQALDEVHVRLVHLAQELAGVGGERLDVAPLPLREDRVEGQGRLPRARQTGEDDEWITGQVKVDVAQVVLAGPAHEESVTHPPMVGDRDAIRTPVRSPPRRAEPRALHSPPSRAPRAPAIG